MASGGAGSSGSRSAPVPARTPPSEQSSRLGPRATVGASTLPNIGKGTENQDTLIAATTSRGSKNFVGVFDGHGEMGGRISHFASESLARNLFNKSSLKNDPKSALNEAYRETQAQIMQDHGGDAQHSGTTAVSAYQNGEKLFVANVGDSRAVLGRCATGASRSSQATLRAIELSSDHKPDREDERRRILGKGGQVKQGIFPVRDILGSVSFVPAGPQRVVDKTGLGGLAMSRSLGDAQYHPYVSSKPEILEKRLDARDKVLILGSDGVWDQMSSREAVNIARHHKDPQAAARHITDAARKRWVAETGGCVSDDITAVVMRLDHGASSRRDRGGSIRATSDTSSRRSTNSKLNSLLDSRHPATSMVSGQVAPFLPSPHVPNHMLPAAGRRAFA